jgi:hypothetical protein
MYVAPYKMLTEIPAMDRFTIRKVNVVPWLKPRI